MADLPPAPTFACPRGWAGHQCARDRGHRGGHRCQCGTVFSTAPTHHVTHHDLTTLTFPESRAA